MLDHHPLASSDPDVDRDDCALVERAVAGSREALRQLVARHQTFIFNVALKMYGSRPDAEDLTQEVLVKVITALRTFRGQSAFRTWLYRITVNHFLKAGRRGMEILVDDFATYFDQIAAVPDTADEDPAGGVLAAGVIEELRIRCTTGMLMCLTREQRLTFILGDIFGVDHRLGAELLDISPANFRVRLTRARGDLRNWMHRRCGLVNAANPCRCPKKARAYVQRGVLDPARLVFNTDYVVRVEAVARRGARSAMDRVDDLHRQVFLEHPYQLSKARIVEEILNDDTVRTFFDLGGG